MHVGKGISLSNLTGEVTDGQILEFEMSCAVAAEAMGFESAFLPEHHFRGYHMCPNVLQFLTYLAGRTERMLLGSMVVVLPWHHPVRVAEELAVLDHLSGGRLVLGVGRGLGRVEFEGFGLEMGESRGRFLEYATAIVKAFDTGVIFSEGEYYQQPPTELRPAPRSPLRGRVYASAVSPESMELMAQLGFGVMVIAQKPWETTVAEVRGYRERYVELNGQEPPRTLLVSMVNVAESEQQAVELHEQYTNGYARSCLEHYEFDNTNLADVPGYEYYGRLAQQVVKYGADKFIRFLADLQISGTPEQVTEQLAEHVRELDGGGVLAVTSFGGMPFGVARANQELFARTVLPRLRSIDPFRQIDVPGLDALVS